MTDPTPRAREEGVREALVAVLAATPPTQHYRLAEALGIVSDEDVFHVLRWSDTADALLALRASRSPVDPEGA